MLRTIGQAIDDYFLNSPAWPFPVDQIDVEKEADDFLRDESPWARGLAMQLKFARKRPAMQ